MSLTNTIKEFLWIILKDLQALPSGTMSEMLFTTMSYNYWIAVAGSQIETAIFLKTLEVGTMMTNTAGKIILVLTFCSIGLAVTTTLAKPSWNVNETEYCEFTTPATMIIALVVLVIVLMVIVFALYRSHQSRRPSDSEEHVGFEGVGDQWRSVDQVDSRDSLHATSSHNRLFTAVQAVISELKRKSGENYETPKDTFLFSRKFDEKHVTKLRNIEDDIFVEDIELVNIETSSEHRRDSKKYETPLEDVDENDPVVDINETPYSMEELSIGGMI